MSQLYSMEVLRLAATIPFQSRLSHPDGTAEKRSAICGSRITVDVNIGQGGAVRDLGQDVKACALGQAAANLMGSSALGQDVEGLRRLRRMLAGYLAGLSNDLSLLPSAEVLGPARAFAARHSAILLPFDAVIAAVEDAVQSRSARLRVAGESHQMPKSIQRDAG